MEKRREHLMHMLRLLRRATCRQHMSHMASRNHMRI